MGRDGRVGGEIGGDGVCRGVEEAEDVPRAVAGGDVVGCGLLGLDRAGLAGAGG